MFLVPKDMTLNKYYKYLYYIIIYIIYLFIIYLFINKYILFINKYSGSSYGLNYYIQ